MYFYRKHGGTVAEIIPRNPATMFFLLNFRKYLINPERIFKETSGDVPRDNRGENSKEKLGKECTLKVFLEESLYEFCFYLQKEGAFHDNYRKKIVKNNLGSDFLGIILDKAPY